MDADPIAAFINEKRRIKQAALFNEQVEETLGHKPQVVKRFGEVMNDFAANKIDIPAAVQEILYLFHGYPHLLHHFNQFLPVEARIPVEDYVRQIPFHYGPCTCDAPRAAPYIHSVAPHLLVPNQVARPQVRNPEQNPASNFTDAEHFILTVKNRYADRPQIYNMFVDILRSFRKRELAVVDVYHQTKSLLRDTPELFNDFLRFLPSEESAILVTSTSER